MLGTPSNPMLAQAEQGIIAKVQPALQAQLSQVMQAAQTILHSPQTQDKMHELLDHTTDANAPTIAGQGSAHLMVELMIQSGNKLPMQLFVPAALCIAFEYLDTAAKAGRIQITPQLIAHTAQASTAAVLKALKITTQMMHDAVAKGQQAKGAPSGAGAPVAPTAPPAAPAATGIVGSQMAGA